MTRRSLPLFALALAARAAHAEPDAVTEVITDDNFNPDRINQLEGNGYTLTPGLVIHPSIGLQGGGTTNVFYSDEGTSGAGYLRLVGGAYLATDHAKTEDLGTPDPDAPEQQLELTPRTYELRSGMQLGYQEFLSGSDVVRSQRNLNVRAMADFVLFPAGPFTISASDWYTRDVRSPNYETSGTLNRDDNRGRISLGFHPQSGTISGSMFYENWLEVFEGGLSWANRMNQRIGADFNWHWLPVTQFTSELSAGFNGPLGTSVLEGMPYKTDSHPLRGVVGIATAITEAVNLKAHIGYARASYDVGEGYSAPIGGAEVGYRWSSTGRAVVLYDFDHFDSVNANFYGDTLLAAKAIQTYKKWVFDGGPELHRRTFGGIPMAIGLPDRKDTVFALRARAQMPIADRFSLSAEYAFETVQTTYRATEFDLNGNPIGTYDPSYIRHEFMLGVRAAY
jgi:hypothetical protein